MSYTDHASGDVTGYEERIIDLHKKHYSCASIGRMLNLHSTAISAFLRERGLLWLGKVGPDHPAWRGGETMKYGYPLVWKPDHPRSQRGKYVYKHLVVMEEKIGRYIARDEPIHHIDLDRENANVDNLYLCKDEKEHQQLHASLDRITGKLIRAGVIKFKDGQYYVESSN